jgi:hypothetical protein
MLVPITSRLERGVARPPGALISVRVGAGRPVGRSERGEKKTVVSSSWYNRSVIVLSGELAVPCTRNPLQRGRIPRLRHGSVESAGLVDVENRVLRGGAL